MAKDFPNLAKEIDIQVQEQERVPNKNPKRQVTRHIITKMPKVIGKEIILKVAREKQLVTHKVAPLRLSAYFSKGTLQDRRDRHKIINVIKSKD